MKSLATHRVVETYKAHVDEGNDQKNVEFYAKNKLSPILESEAIAFTLNLSKKDIDMSNL